MVRSVGALLCSAAVALAVGCTQAQPRPPAPPAGPAPTTRRTDLDLSLRRGEALPRHGVTLQVFGMAGDYILTIDFDARTARSVETNTMLGDVPPTVKQFTLTPAQVAAFREASQSAKAVSPIPEPPHATDVREDLTVLDGDEVFYLMGHPIGGSDDYPNAIGALMTMLYETGGA